MDSTALITIGSLIFSVLIVDGILLAIIFYTRHKVAQVSSWISTMGTVIFSTVEWRRSGDNSGSSAYPVVHYTYQVMGQLLQGRKIAPGPDVGGSGAKKIVERYPAGAQVTVYYDPDNPADAVLERGMPGYIKWLWITLVLVDVFMCGLSVFLAFVL